MSLLPQPQVAFVPYSFSRGTAAEKDVRVSMEMAYAGFNRYQSQIGPDHPSYSLDADGKDYDKTCFGLFRSTVGPDVKKDSLFENID